MVRHVIETVTPKEIQHIDEGILASFKTVIDPDESENAITRIFTNVKNGGRVGSTDTRKCLKIIDKWCAQLDTDATMAERLFALAELLWTLRQAGYTVHSDKCWNALVTIFHRRGDRERTMQALGRLESAGYEVEAWVFSMAIELSLQAGDTDQALHLYMQSCRTAAGRDRTNVPVSDPTRAGLIVKDVQYLGDISPAVSFLASLHYCRDTVPDIAFQVLRDGIDLFRVECSASSEQDQKWTWLDELDEYLQIKSASGYDVQSTFGYAYEDGDLRVILKRAGGIR